MHLHFPGCMYSCGRTSARVSLLPLLLPLTDWRVLQRQLRLLASALSAFFGFDAATQCPLPLWEGPQAPLASCAHDVPAAQVCLTQESSIRKPTSEPPTLHPSPVPSLRWRRTQEGSACWFPAQRKHSLKACCICTPSDWVLPPNLSQLL